jgi:hypothetical protein
MEDYGRGPSMTRREDDSMAFPEPPWTQAPSEVLAWMSSTGGRSRRESLRRPTRVKTFDGRLPISEEKHLLARMARMGLGQTKNGGVHLPHLVTRLVHRAPPVVFLGRFGGTRVHVRVRKGSRLEVGVTFTPQIRFRKAWRLVSELGLRPGDGIWA